MTLLPIVPLVAVVEFGSGSAWISIDLAVLDPDPYTGNTDLDPDLGAWKFTKINKLRYLVSCYLSKRHAP